MLTLFGVVEGIWAAVALHRYAEHRRRAYVPKHPRAGLTPPG